MAIFFIFTIRRILQIDWTAYVKISTCVQGLILIVIDPALYYNKNEQLECSKSSKGVHRLSESLARIKEGQNGRSKTMA
ncbi:hypothetical protein ABE29_22440 [Cytobacillus firmus]|nr:hypothetical protein [Cytobacillus firmus]MBG9546439.1 hypothetical protein [Cytobacillus firmus]MBG9552731.1 hypothetical protein [Cytobacillus firmus]MBG9558944.1 hypothetical protein [Cytobacillus firmus]MBG9576866.1 hypothetical protein [Cytobacillus firmus]